MTRLDNRIRPHESHPSVRERLSARAATDCTAADRVRVWQFAGLLTAATLLLLATGCGGAAPTEAHLNPPKPGSLQIDIGGLGSAGQAAVTVTGPNGFSQQITQTQTLSSLVAGSYAVQAAGVTMDGDTFDVSPANQVVSVGAGQISNVSLVYAIATGRIALTVGGLPGGAQGTMTLAGPTAITRAVAGSDTIRGLAPGNYLVKAGPVVAAGDRYGASPDSILTLVTPGTAPSPVTFGYSLTSGRLTVTVNGAPAGTTPDITVTGPASYNRHLSATETLVGLAPGVYAVAAAPVTSNGHSYAGTAAPASVTVAAGSTPAITTVTYGIATGTLTVTVEGLPAGSAGSVTVTGPAGFNQPIAATTTTFTGVPPGVYTIAAAQVSLSGVVYTVQPASQTATVTASATPVVRTVAYHQGVGAIGLTVSGLPGGVSGAVTVSGQGFRHAYGSSTTVGSLTPGTYTISASPVTSGQTYAPTPPTQTVTVSIGATVHATVIYAGTGGTLTVTVNGLPNGTNAAIVVNGPSGYTHNVTASATLVSLMAGTYTLAATPVTVTSQTYTPTPSNPSASVTSGSVSAVTITYAVAPTTTLNLTIAAMYLTQAVATLDGSTPLVAGRNAYLRVFAIANQVNTATPAVRIRLYSGATLIQTATIPAPGTAVPTSVNEGSLASSWNLLVPAASVQPNLKVVADVDPAGAVLESSETDNQFPASGTQDVLVVPVPTWNVRFVPILQQANGLQGNVTVGNGSQFLVDALKLLPVAGYDADVRSVYTTTAPAVDAGDANNAWGMILSEMAALRATDASSRYYYGVLQTSYSSGVAGMGYVGGSAHAAIGWDDLPSGSDIMAHEVGHNMGRQHSPSCGATGTDPSYPYANGTTGSYGLDVDSLNVKPPTRFDFMGYCNPDWVSDYTWRGLIAFRQAGPNNAPVAAVPAGTVAGLLIWGRVTSAGVVWEPAFRVPVPVDAPSQSGAYRITGHGADGSELFSYRFDPVMTMVRQVGARHEHHFSVVVPLDDRADQSLARLTLETGAGTFTRSTQSPAAPGRPPVALKDPGADLVRPNARQVRLRWDAATYPVVMVRDATGRVISFARGGIATLWTQSPRFDVVFSDGVAERRVRGMVAH